MVDGFKVAHYQRHGKWSWSLCTRKYNGKIESVEFGMRVPAFKSLLLCLPCIILGKLLTLSGSQFPHLPNKNDKDSNPVVMKIKWVGSWHIMNTQELLADIIEVCLVITKKDWWVKFRGWHLFEMRSQVQQNKNCKRIQEFYPEGDSWAWLASKWLWAGGLHDEE